MYTLKYHNTDLTKLSFLVTGGAGFIGSNLVEYLLKYNAKNIIILDNLSTGRIENIKDFITNSNVTFIEGDIRSFETCLSASKDVDFIFHEAALGSVPRSIKDPITTNEVNVSGFLNILTAAKQNSVKRVVYAASSSTYGDSKVLPKVEDKIGKPLSPYAITKYINELYAENFHQIYGLEVIGLRYFNVFGPKQNPNGAYAAVIPKFIFAALEKTSPHINGDGLTSRDFTFIENVIECNIKALTTNSINDVFNVAYGESTTLIDLWEAISSIDNINVKPVFGKERIGDVKHSLANIDKAKQKLGYNPQFSIANSIELTYNWYKNH